MDEQRDITAVKRKDAPSLFRPLREARTMVNNLYSPTKVSARALRRPPLYSIRPTNQRPSCCVAGRFTASRDVRLVID
eukprot:2641748-Prymnesium_polylepis.1